ncbi:hypothetical protein WH95_15585 [Kiloniella litopenaei]|uniref:Uncharacterized protein n=1 Tax=Kiloniella litopenaei TaxID=1549748 RepID=A0A0M2R7I3_9PROT|nr:transporter substrate-binding domain-containing protein [Kiloniella litopenaei]KKJ75980.1 hypothetical protein WH95_15585 [Kiloniella litopenaei]
MHQTLDGVSRAALCRYVFLIFYVLSFILPFKTTAAAEYNIYSYHNTPPFIIRDGEGLSYDLVRYLNKYGDNRFQFKLSVLPRKRLDILLKANRDMIVPWVSPEWFGMGSRSRYLWTPSLLSDANIYFSRKSDSIDIKKMKDLETLILGGVLGHQYSDIDREIEKGRLTRTNAPRERNLIKMLIGKRIDIAIMEESSARYLVRAEKLEQDIYFSPHKHSRFQRHLLINGYLPDVHQFLNETILQMAADPEWIAIKSRYELSVEIN